MEAVDCRRLERLLSRLVSIDTTNDPLSGRRPGPREASAVLEALEAEGATGFKLVEDGPPAPVILSVRGSGRPVTLFLAHYDVVPPGPGWRVTEPFRPVTRGGWLYGRGAADDKSNVAAIALGLAGFQPGRGTLVVAFTGDEETGGESAAWLASYLEREGLWPDRLVNGDGSLEQIIVRRRAAFRAVVEVPAMEGERGRLSPARFETRVSRETMHSAYFIPGVDTHALVAASLYARDRGLQAAWLRGEWVKSNVLPRSVEAGLVEPGGGGDESDEGLTRLLHAVVPLVRAPVEAELYSDYGVTINPNVYRRTSSVHRLFIDIRAMSRRSGRLRDALEYVLENTVGPGRFRLRVSGGSGYLYTPPRAPLVEAARAAARAAGSGSRLVEAGGASDSRHFSPRGVEAIDYGPLGLGIHGPDERVSLASLCRTARFYRELAGILHGG